MSGERKVSFEEWYREAYPRVVAALIAYGANPEDAEDATDEAFARALSRWERVKETASPSAWAFVVARNLLRRTARRRASERSRTERAHRERKPDGGDPADWVVASAEVAAHLAKLSPRQRTVLVLHHGFDISEEDVATLLGVRRSTVSSTLTDARRLLLANRDHLAGTSGSTRVTPNEKSRDKRALAAAERSHRQAKEAR